MFITKVPKVTARMDGARMEIREQELCFCRTQVPLVFGIPHSYSVTSFALNLYRSEQFNWNRCAAISVISRTASCKYSQLHATTRI